MSAEGNDFAGKVALAGWRAWPPARDWEKTVRAAGWELDSLAARDLFARRDGGLLFAMLEARGRDPEGKPLLPYILVRGAACVIVPVVRNRETGERRYLMILQRRVGGGDLSLEFPAGMVDGDEDPVAAAARELAEETGLEAPATLTPLWERPLYSTPGLSDEHLYFYAAEYDLDAARYHALEGGDAGHAGEGEHIVTTLKTYAEAVRGISSLQPLLAFFLHRLRYGELS